MGTPDNQIWAREEPAETLDSIRQDADRANTLGALLRAGGNHRTAAKMLGVETGDIFVLRRTLGIDEGELVHGTEIRIDPPRIRQELLEEVKRKCEPIFNSPTPDSRRPAPNNATPRNAPREIRPLKEALELFEPAIIKKTLEVWRWNRQKTADVLGINRSTLYKKMKKYDLLFLSGHEPRILQPGPQGDERAESGEYGKQDQFGNDDPRHTLQETVDDRG